MSIFIKLTFFTCILDLKNKDKEKVSIKLFIGNSYSVLSSRSAATFQKVLSTSVYESETNVLVHQLWFLKHICRN